MTLIEAPVWETAMQYLTNFQFEGRGRGGNHTYAVAQDVLDGLRTQATRLREADRVPLSDVMTLIFVEYLMVQAFPRLILYSDLTESQFRLRQAARRAIPADLSIPDNAPRSEETALLAYRMLLWESLDQELAAALQSTELQEIRRVLNGTFLTSYEKSHLEEPVEDFSSIFHAANGAAQRPSDTLKTQIETASQSVKDLLRHNQVLPDQLGSIRVRTESVRVNDVYRLATRTNTPFQPAYLLGWQWLHEDWINLARISEQLRTESEPAWLLLMLSKLQYELHAPGWEHTKTTVSHTLDALQPLLSPEWHARCADLVLQHGEKNQHKYPVGSCTQELVSPLIDGWRTELTTHQKLIKRSNFVQATVQRALLEPLTDLDRNELAGQIPHYLTLSDPILAKNLYEPLNDPKADRGIYFTQESVK